MSFIPEFLSRLKFIIPLMPLTVQSKVAVLSPLGWTTVVHLPARLMDPAGPVEELSSSQVCPAGQRETVPLACLVWARCAL